MIFSNKDLTETCGLIRGTVLGTANDVVPRMHLRMQSGDLVK